MIILKIAATIALAALCGWMFRLGGAASAHARWLRMLGVEVTEFLGLIVWFGWSWWLIPTTALAWTECTYFKAKGTEAKWWNWLICGIQYALIPIPLVFLGHIPWEGLIDRAIVLIPVITLWRTFQGNVQWSEGGAGGWQIITLPLLALHKLFWMYLIH